MSRLKRFSFIRDATPKATNTATPNPAHARNQSSMTGQGPNRHRQHHLANFGNSTAAGAMSELGNVVARTAAGMSFRNAQPAGHQLC
jgi:hypothetical protein